GVAVTRIGTIRGLSAPSERPAIAWRDATGAPLALTLHGFDHFHAD
ncbi:TPA: thiamine monophosphate kinase, partial [Burkholderia lata]